MDRGFEQFIFAALILLAGLLDWVVRSLKNRSSPPEGQQTATRDPAEAFPEDDDATWSEPTEVDSEQPQPIPEQPAAPVPARTVPPRVEVFTVPLAAAPAVSARSLVTAAPPRRRPRNRWVNDAADARRAVVLLEILGPCKGLEPPRLRE